MKIVKSLGLAGVVLATVAGVGTGYASAEDFSPSWSGAYIGANIGYGWGSGDASVLPKAPAVAPPDFPDIANFIDAIREAGVFPTSLSPSERGIVGGGQVGYNWELPSGWVVGIEADLQASGIKGSDTRIQTPQFFEVTSTSVSKDVNWYGTVRARGGYLINPQWLVYATGGLAYGETSLGFHTIDLDFGCIPGGTICADDKSSGVRLGWTLGAGLETMLSSNWSVKAEYLYVDLGKRSFDATSNSPVLFATSAKFNEQTIHVGLNYHFN
jgi:outer membrane immunogenic protein